MTNAETRTLTAYHEAGHYVAAYVSGRHIHTYGLTITPLGRSLGSVSGECPDLSDARAIEDEVVQLYAGHAAVVYGFPGHHDWSRAGSGGDDEQADALLCHLDQPEEEAEARLRARAADLIAEHWHLVEALAADLLENETVDADEAEYVLLTAEGDPGAAEALAMYRALKRAAGA